MKKRSPKKQERLRHQNEKLDKYLTHYYVMKLGKQSIAIGEAGRVRRLGRQKWSAQLGVWQIIKGTHNFHFESFGEVRNDVVKGPIFRLVVKERFRGLVTVKKPPAPQKKN
jgi:hypothetical protein